MSCEKCRAAVDGTGSLGERMDAATDVICGCERVSVSDLSPGPIRDEEELHFIVPSPDGMINGKPNPTFLIPLDNDGLSILRGAAADNEFQQTLQELTARWSPKARRFHGVVTFDARKVRYVADSRLCCAYDTALPGKPHHGDIAGPAIKEDTKSATRRQQERRIKHLIDTAMIRFETATAFRDGVLSKFAES